MNVKKEYVMPEVAVRNIEIENAFCLNTSDSEGSGEQFGKEFDIDEEDDYWD